MRKKTRQLAVYGVLLAVVAAAGTLAWTEVRGSAGAPPSNTRTVTVQTGTVSATVSATGTIEPASTTSVAFGASGTVTEVLVKAGDSVTAGQVLAKVDTKAADKALRLAKLDLTDATTTLNNLYTGVSTTNAGSGATGAGGASGSSGGTSATATSRAEIAVEAAEDAVTEAEATLAATTLTAPVAGLVTTVNGAVGDSVTAGRTSTSSSGSSAASAGTSTGTGGPTGTGSSSSSSSSTGSAFLTIVDPSTYQVKVTFPESDATKVKVGQAATITVDAVSNTTMNGTVASMDSTSTVTSNVVTYGAVITITTPPASLKAGLSATVNVTTATRTDVVALATAAVQTQAGQSYVNKLVNGQEVRTDVTVGIQGDSTTEITAGLSAGDQVVIATGTITTTSGGTGSQTGNRSGTLTGGGGQFPGGGAPTVGPIGAPTGGGPR